MAVKDIYVADFETTTIEPTKVWAWGVSKVNDPDYFDIGYSIESFIKFLKSIKQDVTTMFFHNERFDGSFITDYLLKHGFNWVEDKKDFMGNDFTTIIDGNGQYYLIDICFKSWIDKNGKSKSKHVTIQDSAKLLRMDVEGIAKTFELEIRKGKIDYTVHNVDNVPVTPTEEEYLKNDVQIVAMGLNRFFEAITREDEKRFHAPMTIGVAALKDYKKHIGESCFKARFPQLPPDVDDFVRCSYKGGFTQANEAYTEQTINEGMVLDVNSIYAYVMKSKLLPYGLPLAFQGDYNELPQNIKKSHPLYVQQIRCIFTIKKNKIPCIQIKNSNYYLGNEFQKQSNGEAVMIVTSVELELIKKHYKITVLEYLGGYAFAGASCMFATWVNKWFKVKEYAEKVNNKGMRKVAKEMLVNLYGKFGTKPIIKSKKPVLFGKKVILKDVLYPCYDKDGNKIFDNGIPRMTNLKYREPIYIPIATFVTAYARSITVSTAQKIHEQSIKECGYSRWLYCDTDSIHLQGYDLPQIDIDPVKLGAWKIENTFKRAKYLQSKRYIEDAYKDPQAHEGETKFIVKCSGLQKQFHNEVTWDNFTLGGNIPTTYTKITHKIVEGGTILVKSKFTLKDNITIMSDDLDKSEDIIYNVNRDTIENMNN